MYWVLCFSSATPRSRCRQGVVLKAIGKPMWRAAQAIGKLMWRGVALRCLRTSKSELTKCGAVLPQHLTDCGSEARRRIATWAA